MFNFFKRKKEERAFSPSLFTVGGSVVGPVSNDQASRLASVAASIKVISETLMMLPIVLYRRLPDGAKEPARDHFLYWLLHSQPNFLQDAAQWKEELTISMLLTGRAYAQIELGRGGVVQEISRFIDPSRVKEELVGKKKVFTISQNGKTVKLSQDRVLSMYGHRGLSPIDLARESMTVASYATTSGQNYFANNAKPSLIFSFPKALSPEGHANFKKGYLDEFQGPQNAGKTMILEEGMEVKTISMSNEQSQWIDTMKFTRSEIAAIFRVPPHMIGDLDRATFSNIEQQSLDFVQHCIQPWAVRWEAALSRCLLTEDEQQEYKFEFNLDAFLRGDFLSRQQGLAIQRQNGVINIDEWRAFENRNPLPQGKGQGYIQPMNMTEVGNTSSGTDTQTNGAPPSTTGDGKSTV